MAAFMLILYYLHRQNYLIITERVGQPQATGHRDRALTHGIEQIKCILSAGRQLGKRTRGSVPHWLITFSKVHQLEK